MEVKCGLKRQKCPGSGPSVCLCPWNQNGGGTLTGASRCQSPGITALSCLLLLIIKLVSRRCKKSKRKNKVLPSPRGNLSGNVSGLLWSIVSSL